MRIQNDMKIEELQQQFQEAFPFLKVEFYAHQHEDQEGSLKKELIEKGKLVKESRKEGKEGNLNLEEEMKVSELELSFAEDFGLNAQVFRMSSNGIWLQTIATDDWTLARQNEKGRISSHGNISAE